MVSIWQVVSTIVSLISLDVVNGSFMIKQVVLLVWYFKTLPIQGECTSSIWSCCNLFFIFSQIFATSLKHLLFIFVIVLMCYRKVTFDNIVIIRGNLPPFPLSQIHWKSLTFLHLCTSHYSIIKLIFSSSAGQSDGSWRNQLEFA